MAVTLEDRIIDCLRQRGPLTGSELKESVGEDNLVLWQACMRCEKIATVKIGTRYMRLDRRLEGYACLSPSILREFLSYSVMGQADDPAAIQQKAGEISSHIEGISRKKLELAQDIVSRVMGLASGAWEAGIRICFILAGDIVYNMAHDVPRPERSTGKFVNGSDIDLVIVLDDAAPDEILQAIDKAIYAEKYRMLTTPAFREEIDYVIKRVGRVREQLRFDTFKDMIACKILGEGILLHGSRDLFSELKAMLGACGAAEKLADLEKKAQLFRKNAEKYLLQADPEKAKTESLYLFYPHEESEEFE